MAHALWLSQSIHLRITLAVQEDLSVAQLISPLAFCISPELGSSPIPPFISLVCRIPNVPFFVYSHIYLHTNVLPTSFHTISSVECIIPISAGSGNRNYDGDNPSRS